MPAGISATSRSAAPPCRRPPGTKLIELLPQTRLCHHYGLTEASRAAFLEYHSDGEHLASIGRPSPNVEMAIRDDDGRDLPDGQQGQIAVRGRMVMAAVLEAARSYARCPPRRLALHRRPRLARSGRLLSSHRPPSGRGERRRAKVSPEEVEAVLNGHPAVVESACAGVPDTQGIVGEILKAYIVLRSEVRDEQLIDWLRQRLEEYKVPRIWQRVDRLAKTASGKIQRHLM